MLGVYAVRRESLLRIVTEAPANRAHHFGKIGIVGNFVAKPGEHGAIGGCERWCPFGHGLTNAGCFLVEDVPDCFFSENITQPRSQEPLPVVRVRHGVKVRNQVLIADWPLMRKMLTGGRAANIGAISQVVLNPTF